MRVGRSKDVFPVIDLLRVWLPRQGPLNKVLRIRVGRTAATSVATNVAEFGGPCGSGAAMKLLWPYSYRINDLELTRLIESNRVLPAWCERTDSFDMRSVLAPALLTRSLSLSVL